MIAEVDPDFLALPRHQLADAALSAAVAGDMAPFDRLLALVSAPFTEQADAEEYARPAPESFGKFTTYCGT